MEDPHPFKITLKLLKGAIRPNVMDRIAAIRRAASHVIHKEIGQDDAGTLTVHASSQHGHDTAGIRRLFRNLGGNVSVSVEGGPSEPRSLAA